MPGTGHERPFERPLGERSPLVGTDPVDGADLAIDVENCVDPPVVLDFLGASRGQFTQVAILTNPGIRTTPLGQPRRPRPVRSIGRRKLAFSRRLPIFQSITAVKPREPIWGHAGLPGGYTRTRRTRSERPESRDGSIMPRGEDFDLVGGRGRHGRTRHGLPGAAARAPRGPARSPHQARGLRGLLRPRSAHLRRRGHGPDGPGPRRADRRPPRVARRRFLARSRRPAIASTCPTARSTSSPTPRRSRRPRPPPSPVGPGRSGASGGCRRRSGRRLFRVGGARAPAPPARRRATWSTTSASSACRGPAGRLDRGLTVRDVLRLLGLDRDVAVPVADRDAPARHRPGRPRDRPLRQRRRLPPGLPDAG